MEEARYGGLIDKYWILQTIVIPLLILTSIIVIIFFILSYGFSTENFRLSCEAYGGRFYELQNTSCEMWHENCIFNCNLNNKVYNLDELEHQVSYSKYFCIEDCRYENSKDNGLRCVC